MKVETTPLEGLLVIEPDVFRDQRGFFTETYNQERYAAAGITARFVQDNQSMSCYGVVRGLHFQKGEWMQAKLVSCVVGRVLDVAVDLRKGSKTYGKWFSVELNDENHRQLFIPRGFAHGFSVLSEKAIFSYKCDNLYNKQSEGGVRLDDEAIGIDWRIPQQDWIISDKDRLHPFLKDAKIEL